MKGISPLIATVLLIAFTIAVGGILSIFLTGFTSKSTGTVSSQGQNQISCASNNPTVDKVVYPNAGGPLNVSVSNAGIYNITNITFYVTVSNATTFTVSSGTLAGNWYLNPGSSNSSTLLSTSGGVSITTVRIVGYCLSNQVVAGSCDAGQSCMQVV